MAVLTHYTSGTQVRKVRAAGIVVILAHENDPELGGCEFATFFRTTPQAYAPYSCHSNATCSSWADADVGFIWTRARTYYGCSTYIMILLLRYALMV